MFDELKCHKVGFIIDDLQEYPKMSDKYSLKICRSIIQYLIHSDGFTPKQIANLASTSIESIQSIYYDNLMPSSVETQRQLIRLYSIVIELKQSSLRLDV